MKFRDYDGGIATANTVISIAKAIKNAFEDENGIMEQLAQNYQSVNGADVQSTYNSHFKERYDAFYGEVENISKNIENAVDTFKTADTKVQDQIDSNIA